MPKKKIEVKIKKARDGFVGYWECHADYGESVEELKRKIAKSYEEKGENVEIVFK